MKSKIIYGLSALCLVLILIATFMPAGALRFSKTVLYLAALVPVVISLVLIVFSRSCPCCGRWMCYFWCKRLCPICGTEIQ